MRITEALIPPDGYNVLTNVMFAVHIDAPTEGENIYVWELSHPKFEHGTTDTDWTPAPEDLQQQVIDSTTELDNKLSGDIETLRTETSTSISQTNSKIDIEISSVTSSIEETNTKLDDTDKA